MKIWRTKVWNPLDIVSLKLAALALGLILGGYYPEWAMRNRWPLTILLVLFAVRPFYAYYIRKD